RVFSVGSVDLHGDDLVLWIRRDDDLKDLKEFKDIAAGFVSLVMAAFCLLQCQQWSGIQQPIEPVVAEAIRAHVIVTIPLLVAGFGFGLLGRHTKMGRAGITVSALVFVWFLRCAIHAIRLGVNMF